MFDFTWEELVPALLAVTMMALIGYIAIVLLMVLT